jgi:putative flippase GtrA
MTHVGEVTVEAGPSQARGPGRVAEILLKSAAGSQPAFKRPGQTVIMRTVTTAQAQPLPHTMPAASSRAAKAIVTPLSPAPAVLPPRPPAAAPGVARVSRDLLRAPRRASVEIVVPVYNEEAGLEPNVRRLRAYLDEEFPFPALVTIADNASVDGTWAVAQRLERELPGVRAFHLDQKGRGRALRTVWTQSDADVVAYMDVDLATDLRALLPLVAPLLSGHSDVAIGSRLAHSATVERGPKREFISRTYNLILKIALRNRFSDAQCGFKAVSRQVALHVVPHVVDDQWFFDTELLVLAERNGLRIHEVPVDWTDDPDSRVNITRTALDDLKGTWRMIRRRWSGQDQLALPSGLGRRKARRARAGVLAGLRGLRRLMYGHRRFLKFAAVGAVNTAVTFAVFNACAGLGAPAAAANAAGWTAGFVNSFVLNRAWTFADRRDLPTGRVLTRFATTNVVAFAVSEAVVVAGAALLPAGMTTLAHTLALNAVELVAVAVSLCVNYALALRWAFRARSV